MEPGKKQEKHRSAIILAGGNSRRMSRNKALLPVGKHTLIEEIIGQIRNLFSEILISASHPGIYEFLGRRVVCDEQPGRGPLAAILAALKASFSPVNFVIACDIPEIDIPLVESMFDRAQKYHIVVPHHADGKTEPLFAVYRRSLIPLIQEQIHSGDLKISSLYPKCRTAFVAIGNGRRFLNLNTVEDYREFLLHAPSRSRSQRVRNRP
jgi:molybdopterin-guanine dinucleotide biosynthesis protein A